MIEPSTRRQFLAASAALAATGPLLAAGVAKGQNPPVAQQPGPAFGQGIMVGEVTDTSAIVQVRVTRGTDLIDGDVFDDGDPLKDGDLPGAIGRVRFACHRNDLPDNPVPRWSGWITTSPDNDFIARIVFDQLVPGATYVCIAEVEELDPSFGGQTRKEVHFNTHPGKDASVPVKFVMSSCMNYDKFTGSDGSDRSRGYQGEDRAMGYPAAAAVLEQKPDFMFFAGDVVYYDKVPKVQTLADMRAKWHRQENLPRMIALHAAVPGYWMKDDHDHRNNDSDATKDYFPSHELGIKTFREQCPILAQGDDTSPTYRTHRVSKDLQVWMVEGRDYRSPNKADDNEDKSIWGVEQRAWLEKTLLESDASYRIIISPTPLVGPDDGYKSDNHTNPRGFAFEGHLFKQWGAENNLWANTFLLCGDRHWQYHSIDPSGAQEFSCGAFNDENSRMGRAPGDKNSTDPEALVTQLFTSPKPSGGFITVVVEPGKGDVKGDIRFEFYDDLGEELYRYAVGAEQP